MKERKRESCCIWISFYILRGCLHLCCCVGNPKLKSIRVSVLRWNFPIGS
ncbi:hypothetical protein RchiOBHm_Chr3g0491641 [Rosa chinensis]|uniref:Uncharacterized protein n=1 Tax=Rosa chinensis TaxID=74649 RepID=A0A2P6RG98_ROSCH|nr:hypothetical protein RchiOBHm_Chr3g0491641 [Rosa chinensis]